MKKLFSGSFAGSLWKSIGCFVMPLVLAALLLSPGLSSSKYVLGPVQYALSLVSGEYAGTRLTAISPIFGTTVPGETLTAGGLSPSGATATYQWQKSNTPDGVYVDISDATAREFVVTFDENNSYLRVVAKGFGSYTGSVSSAPIGPVVTTAILITEIDPISGNPYVGQELTAGAITPPEATVTYQWQRSTSANGVYSDIDGACDSNYTLVADDIDCFIQVMVQGSGIYAGKVSARIGPIRSGVTPLIDISPIGGTTEVGKTLTVGILSPEAAEADYQWQSSDRANGIYVDIEGATAGTYVLREEDEGRYLKVVATGKGAYSGVVVSGYTGPVTAGATPVTAIAISGNNEVGQTLTTAGSLAPAGATVTYRWYRAEASDGNYSPISGAVGSTYTLAEADFNKFIRVEATGSGIYSGTVTSDPTGRIAARPLTAIGPISGTTKVGETLTAGTVSPPGATVTYQWQRAESVGGQYTDIGGATGSTYLLTEDDADYYLRVTAIGSGAYTGDVRSAASGKVIAEEAVGQIEDLISINDITGHTRIYQTLTAGTVFPYGATVTYQWYRSDTAAGSYTAIPGATDKTYSTTPADKNSYLKVTAIGSGSFGGTVTSVAAGPITAIPLVSIGPVVGTTKIGEELAAGAIIPLGATVDYQWQKATSLDGDYSNIIGAVSKEYALVETDENMYIRAVATGKNLYSGTVYSPGTGPVSVTAIPVTAMAPIEGIPQVGYVLTAGVTTPVDATVTYQWQRAESATGPYADINGAIESTYTLTPEDVDQYIKLVIKGSGIYTTEPNGISRITPDKIAARPLEGISNIIGKAAVGQVLTVGTVTPYGAEVTYQWQRSYITENKNEEEIEYVDISGATMNLYTLTTDDNECYLRVEVKAVEGSGYSGTVYSNNTGPVGSPNAIINIADIVGITRVGNTLTAGTVLPYGSTVSYQWQSSGQIDGTYANINGAVSSTYTLTAAEYERYIRVVASGTGEYFGETISNPTDIIAKGEVTAISPILGATISGETLTAGSVNPVGATVAYQWQRSDTAGSNFVHIAGATGNNYILTEDDEGRLIKVIATGIGAYEGLADAVTGEPISTDETTITPLVSITATTGTARVGGTLVAGTVNPSGATVTYQWQRAINPAGPYTNIGGETSATYTLIPEDYGKYIRPVATGSGVYSGSVWPSGTEVKDKQLITAIADITGTPAVGETVVAGAVTPAGATVTYQWQRADKKNNPNGDYSDILGATAESYTLTSDDNNLFVRVVVKGTGAFETGDPNGLISNYYGRITDAPNKLTAIGPITGVAQVGHKLTAGMTVPYGASVTHQWLRKNIGAETYYEIPGAVFSTYTTTVDDYDTYIKVAVTGSGAYSGWVESEPTDLISASPVTGISAPGGTLVPGYALTAGSVTPAGATVTYQWQRSEQAEDNFLDINGATSGVYLLGDADRDCYLRVVATGYHAYTGIATSAAAGPVSSIVPDEITAIGNISGTARVYSTLTAGNLTPAEANVTYQWQRAKASGGPYENIIGATGSSYLLIPADYNQFIRVLATGTGSYTGTVQSNVVGAVTPCPISDLTDLTGPARVGHSLVAGDVTPADATVNYEWYIAKQTHQTPVYIGSTKSVVVPEKFLTDQSKTEGRYIRVKVIGVGAFSGEIYSNWVEIQAAIQLTPIDAIGAISGTSALGQTLTAGVLTPGDATVSYQWQRSAKYNGTYQNIIGATGSSYTVQNEDLGYYLKVAATGTGSYSGMVISSPIGPVVAAEQTISITGISDILYTTVPELTLTAGTVMPLGAEVSYQWQISNSNDPDGSYSNISGATSNIYTIPVEQALNRYFKVMVTGVGIYSGTVTSAYTGPVVTEAIPVTGISISGITKVGETLSATSVMPPEATITYQWYTLTSLDEGGIALDIPGAVFSTFTPSVNEYNYYIGVVVTGSGAYIGSVSATTASKVIGIMYSADMNILAPIAGEVPQTAAEVEAATDSYDFTVTGLIWYGDLAEGVFDENEVYSAEIELTSKNSKVFVSTSFMPIVPNAESVGEAITDGTEVGNTVTFTVTFSKTGSVETGSMELMENAGFELEPEDGVEYEPGDAENDEPEDDENDSPGDAENDEPEDAENDNPGDAENDEPEDAENDEPGDAENDEPEDAENDEPEDAENDEPEDAENDEPEDDENDSPEDAENDEPEDAENDESEDAENDEPEDDGNDEPEDAENDNPGDAENDEPGDAENDEPEDDGNDEFEDAENDSPGNDENDNP